MALIKCPECGKEISDKAKACPNCGYPLDLKDDLVVPEEKYLKSYNISSDNQNSVTENKHNEIIQKKLEEYEKSKHILSEYAESKSKSASYDNENDTSRNKYNEIMQSQIEEYKVKKLKNSKLSIISFVCFCTVIGIPISIFLAVYDLTKGDDEHKHGFSIASIVLSVFLFLFWAVGGENTEEHKSDITEQLVQDKEEENKKEDITNSYDFYINETEKEEIKEYIPKDEIDNVYADPYRYYGKYVVLSGRMFSDPQIEDGKISFQMYGDVENNENNTYVVYESYNSKDVKNYEYVIVEGKIKGERTGINAFGGLISTLEIEAISVQESNYIDIVVPTIKEIEPKQTIEQMGYSVTIDKIQFAEKETRVYLSVSNNGSENFSIYSWNTKIVQDGKQYENQSNYDYEYNELQTDLLVGVSSSGMLFFPAIDPEKPFTIYLDGSSDNWNEDIETYTFEIANE